MTDSPTSESPSESPVDVTGGDFEASQNGANGENGANGHHPPAPEAAAEQPAPDATTPDDAPDAAPDDGLVDAAVVRAEQIAFLSLASDLARERDVLVVDDGASALAGIAAHLDSLPIGQLATAQPAAYDLVVADVLAADADSLAGATELARIAKPETGLVLIRIPNTPDFKPLADIVIAGFAHHRPLRQHNWVTSALFDDAAFAWDNPSQAAVASLRKLAGAAPGEELYTLVLAGHGELPATVPHLAVTRSAVMRDLVEQLHTERERAAAELAELRAANDAQADRIRELDEQVAWFDENELNLRAQIESRPWAQRLLGFWANSVSLARRAKSALRG